MAYTNAIFFLDIEGGSDAARTALTSVTASNPSGTITRMNKTAHGLVTGAIVTASLFSAWLNGSWKITVVDADNFDLDGAEWQTTADASGTITPFGGSSKADAWLTIGSGATAARTQPGDTIRMMKSADPTTPGSATWTDNSGAVTWAAQKNLVIDDGDTNWTAAANVTCVVNTTTVRKTTSAQAFTPATAFTTGKLGYRTLPSTLDLSGYEQVSFWIRHGAPGTTTAGALELRLCSDTTGDTAVETIPVPAGTAGAWRCVVWNKGAALNSAVASVALYATVDPATTVIYIDNIVACKAASSSDCVTLAHVIGKNSVDEPEWYSILELNNTGIVIGGAQLVQPGSSSYAPRPYRGVTETVATYLLLGTFIDMSQSNRTIKEGGTPGSPITYSGGWDTTDMTTQTGVTYWRGDHYVASAIFGGAFSYISVEKFGAINCHGYAVSALTGNGNVLDLEQVVGCLLGPGNFGVGYRNRLDFTYCQGATDSVVFGGGNQSPFSGNVVTGLRLHGSAIAASTGALNLRPNAKVVIARIDNSGGFGVDTNGMSAAQSTDLYDCVIENNAGATDVKMNGTDCQARLHRCTFGNPTAAASGYSERLYSTNEGGDANTHRVYNQFYTIASATDQRHTASGISWKVTPINAGVTIDTPAWVSLAKVACNANALVTIKVWCRRDNTGLEIGMRLPGVQLPGIPTTDTDVLMTAAADTWEEITLTFTPTMAGVVEILGVAWGGTTYAGWWDDMTIDQAA